MAWVWTVPGLRLALGCFLAALLVNGPTTPGLAQSPSAAVAASPENTVDIAVLVSSRTDRCFDAGDIPAIQHLAALEADRLNRSGQLGARKLKLQFLDDKRDAQQAIANVRTAIAKPATIAVLGISNAATAKTMFDTIGNDIRDSAVPFITDIGVSSLIREHANVYTTRSAQETENIPVLLRFLKDLGVQRPAFVGLKGQVSSAALGDGLKAADSPALVADHRLALRDNQIDGDDLAAVVRDLKDKEVDFLFLSVGSARAAGVIRRLTASGLRPPVFVSGRIDAVRAASPQFAYAGDIYQLAWDGLPDAFNDRLRQRMMRSDLRTWQFEGRRVDAAPGWKNGECKPRPKDAGLDVFDAANLRAIALGTQYGDMVGLIGEMLRDVPESASPKALRARILEQLQTTYAEGRGIYRGNFENWSFNTATHAASRPPLLVMMRGGQSATQLAPHQYVRLRDEVLRRIQTLYIDIDMIRAFRIDDNEKTFQAEFFVFMHHADEAGIDRIEFANAALDPRTSDRQVNVRVLHDGGRSPFYPESMKVYRVSGRFMFDARLGNFPFDTQRFSIDLQPKLGDAPFIIQPPPARLRDQKVETDGWDVIEQFVSYDDDFVRLIDAKTHEQNVVPFYRGSFVWIMRRQALDYYQRVVVPLAFILAIAYLSVFIPRAHFEAVVTIQVTALLSAVALYLALPKIDADTATFSDRIFLFVYLAVSTMIAISIGRIRPFAAKRRAGSLVLGAMHIVGIPMMVVTMAVIVLSASQSNGYSWTEALTGWREMLGW
jgi:ABC-type branched-subunit amino acid transport system substrate-binding protein